MEISGIEDIKLSFFKKSIPLLAHAHTASIKQNHSENYIDKRTYN